MEETLLNLFYNSPILIAFIAGILSFFSPCVLPLIPAYMSYISGASLEELKNGDIKKWRIFIRSFAFVCGFGLIFFIIGLAISGVLNFTKTPLMFQIASIVIIIFGLHIMGVFRLKFLINTKTMDIKLKHPLLIFFAPFVLGICFGLGWSPCVGPIFGAIVISASVESKFGLFLLMLYIIGLAMPFLLTSLALEKMIETFKIIKKYMRLIEIISGLLMIILGILMFVGNFN